MDRRSRLTRWPTLSALCIVALICSCGADRASEAECKAALNKIVDLEIEAAGTSHLSPDMKADIDKQRKKIRDHLRKPFMKQCRNDLPASVVRCRSKAKSKADLAACESR